MKPAKNMVTVYTMGGFGIHREYGAMVWMAEKPYAQYPMVPMIAMIPKGKRKPIGLSGGGFHTWIVIVEGEGLDPADALTERENVGGMMSIQETRYSSFATEWTIEGDEFIRAIDPALIIADYRHTIPMEDWKRFE